VKHFLFAFLIIHSICSFSQNDKLILTEDDNNLWFESLNANEKLSHKIELINDRLINDVNVYIKWDFPDEASVSNFPKLDSIRKIRTKGFCKPFYLVKYKNKFISFKIENPINSEQTKSVIELIT
jgi:hypothetical protein